MSEPPVWRLELGEGAMAFFCSTVDCAEIGSAMGLGCRLKDAGWCVHCHACGELMFEPAFCEMHELEGCPSRHWWMSYYPLRITQRLIGMGVVPRVPRVAMVFLDHLLVSHPHLWDQPEEAVAKMLETRRFWHLLSE